MPGNYLFRFGYEAPDEYRSNLASGTDFESSTWLWIDSENEELAIEWGKVIADRFVEWLFEREGERPYSWTKAQFAYWIETDPKIITLAENLPIVALGDFPDFLLL